MVPHKLIWLNTRDEILGEVGDAILGMRESGMYTTEYMVSYLDEHIDRKCRVAFIDFGETEEAYARIDMFQDLHTIFNLGE